MATFDEIEDLAVRAPNRFQLAALLIDQGARASTNIVFSVASSTS